MIGRRRELGHGWKTISPFLTQTASTRLYSWPTQSRWMLFPFVEYGSRARRSTVGLVRSSQQGCRASHRFTTWGQEQRKPTLFGLLNLAIHHVWVPSNCSTGFSFHCASDHTLPDSWIVAVCPLCGEKRRYLPAYIFRGRLSHDLLMKPRESQIGGERWAR